jgi:AcrR family transcriptional regulator
MAQAQVGRGRRGDSETTRRRVLDAAIETVIEVGYYKASSNEIARRAGITWGVIQHLFGSREQLMLAVVNDIGSRLERVLTEAEVDGESLEARLTSVLETLAAHYEQPAYLVQMQILLDLSVNPKTPTAVRDTLQEQNGQVFDKLAHPLFAQAFGDVAAEQDLVLYAFMTMRGYLAAYSVARLIAELPDGSVIKIVTGTGDDRPLRELLVRGIAATVREEATRRGYAID